MLSPLEREALSWEDGRSSLQEVTPNQLSTAQQGKIQELRNISHTDTQQKQEKKKKKKAVVYETHASSADNYWC